MARKAIRTFLGCMLALSSHASFAQGADAYPGKIIRWVLPYSAGSGVDILARQVAPKLAERLGQPVVMDNKAGAGGVIGFDYMAKAAPDGYQIMSGNNSLLIVSALRPTPFDPLRDFAPVIQLGSTYSVLAIHPSIPANSVSDLVAHSKANPGKLNFSSPSIGTYGHLVTELFKLKTGADLTHIPHKSVGAAVIGLVTGDVGLIITSPELLMSNMKAGKVRVLAVAGSRRSPMLPDVPTTAELGVRDYEAVQWIGMLVPAGVRRDIIQRLNGETTRILAEAAFREEMLKRGVEPSPGTPEQLGALMKNDFATWQNVIKVGNVKSE
jgi:tripartite-type tricarboxylate transporter receptor subunit TctC